MFNRLARAPNYNERSSELRGSNYIYIYIYICIYIYVHTCIYTYIYNIHLYIHAYLYIYIYVCVYTCHGHGVLALEAIALWPLSPLSNRTDGAFASLKKARPSRSQKSKKRISSLGQCKRGAGQIKPKKVTSLVRSIPPPSVLGIKRAQSRGLKGRRFCQGTDIFWFLTFNQRLRSESCRVSTFFDFFAVAELDSRVAKFLHLLPQT